MQVLKEEIRLNILSSAKRLFHEKGYNDASIRDIARFSGITEGNVYRYFSNKENILEGIVSPAYSEVMKFISFSEQLIKEGEKKPFEEFKNIINTAILNISKEYRVELLILMKGTPGTRYEKTREEIISLIEDRMYLGLFKRIPLEDTEAAFLSRTIARSFLDSLIMVIAETQDNHQLERFIYRLNDFYFNQVYKRFQEEG